MVGSRGQRNTSGKAGKVGLQEGGVREARKVQAAPEAVYSSADSGAVGAPSGRRGRIARDASARHPRTSRTEKAATRGTAETPTHGKTGNKNPIMKPAPNAHGTKAKNHGINVQIFHQQKPKYPARCHLCPSEHERKMQ